MRWHLLLGALAALFASTAAAAVVTLTDCTSPPVVARSRSTSVDVGTNDLVIQCPLVPLPGTGRIVVNANRLTIAGPAGSIVTPAGKLAIRLRANADLTLDRTAVEASGNGSIRLLARTGISVQKSIVTTGDVTRTGRSILVRCTASGCPLDVLRSTLTSNYIKVDIQGQILSSASTFLTSGGRALMRIRSRNDGAGLCCSTLKGTNEGNVFISAHAKVDLTRSVITTGENIVVRSGLGGRGPAMLTDATLSNDFGKEGQIVVFAAGGNDLIDIEGATLIDDDFPRRVNDMSNLNGREELPHEGFNNTVGTPRLDT